MFFGSLPSHWGSTRYRDCLPLWQSAYGSTSFVRMGSPLNPTSAFNAGRLYMVSNKLQDCSTNIYTRSSNDTTALNLSDSWVYFRLTSSTFSLLVVVVNNILHVVSNQDIIDSFSESMSKTYKFKNLGHPPLIVGMWITFTPSSLRLDQTHYIRQLGESFSQLDTTPVHYPESLYGCPDDSDYVSSTPLDTSHFSYLSLVGGLLWDTLTRPDITVAVSRAYQHSSAPTADHWRASILVLHFLITTVEHLIVYLRKVWPLVTLTLTSPMSLTNSHGMDTPFTSPNVLSDNSRK